MKFPWGTRLEVLAMKVNLRRIPEYKDAVRNGMTTETIEKKCVTDWRKRIGSSVPSKTPPIIF